MRWGECGRAGAVAVFCIVGGAFASAAEKSTYGKVDTFEPGKKYSCVPTADHKGWDCTATGKAAEPPPAAPAPAPSAPPAASVPTAAALAVAAPAPAPVPSDTARPSTAPVRSGELPRYLNAAAASGGPAPQQPAVVPPTPARKSNISTNPQVPPATSATSVAADAQHQSTPPAAPVAPTPAPPPTAAATTQVPAPAPTPAPRTESATPAATANKAVEPAIEPPAPAAPTTPASTREAPVPPPPPAVAATPQRAARSDNGARGGDEFLALPGDQYVLELAHASSEQEVVTSTPTLPRGDVYKLHLRQNGADVWLLVWGSFDDVSAAREARAELAGTASITPGWPRRIGPLQAEVRRAKE